MSLNDAVDQLRDADREAGRITNWLYAGEFSNAELLDTVLQIEDLADEVRKLADRLGDAGHDEVGGEADDASAALEDAAKYAKLKNIQEACISLEAASEAFMRACDAADH